MNVFITDFKIARPKFVSTQNELLGWMEKLHAPSCSSREKLQRLMGKYCCKEPHIQSRGHVVTQEQASDLSLKSKMKLFCERGDEVFSNFYEEVSHPPQDLLHVTCTGYASPSIAQRAISKKGWGKNTTVTHVYHMGCMAALAAIRIGSGYVQSGKQEVDVVHTEMCTLHFHPEHHEPDQMVAQSLFGDGFIKYRLQNRCERGWRIITMHEEMIEGALDVMKWECEEWGMKMTLSREIPSLIEQHVGHFVASMLEKAKIKQSEALFAIHPGGPKIVDLIGKKLQLTDNQTLATKEILRRYGNMSSATLPHIFDFILNEVSSQERYVVGIAFGPGLTMSGIVLERV